MRLRRQAQVHLEQKEGWVQGGACLKRVCMQGGARASQGGHMQVCKEAKVHLEVKGGGARGCTPKEGSVCA